MLSYTGTRVVTIFYHYETRVVNNMMKEKQSYLLWTVLEERTYPIISLVEGWVTRGLTNFPESQTGAI